MIDHLCPAETSRQLRCSPVEIENQSNAISRNRQLLEVLNSFPGFILVLNQGYMPENIQHQIFQRSFSTKGTGRGVGTYSIKLLGERYLQGQVSFTSAPETGTTFRFRCPIRIEPI